MSADKSKMCCVPNCGKSRDDDVILHSFPNPDKEPERFRTWLYTVGGDILALDNNKIYRYRRVCHEHFATRYLTWSKRLTHDAVPTLQMPGFLVLRKRSNDGTGLSTSAVTSTENIPPPLEQPTTSKGISVQREAFKDITNTIPVDVSENVSAQQPQSGRPKKKKASKGAEKMKPLAQTYSTEVSGLARQIKRLQNAKDSFATRLKKALVLSQNESFLKAMRNFTTMATIFIMLQFREANKSIMGRRFTKQEKIASLYLYKQGPRAYRWLRHIFILPSPATLSRMISVASLKAGINDHLFEHLKKRMKKLQESDRCVILLFDEMSLSQHLDYNRKTDRIIGFVDNGKTITKKIADHALVFMIRGVTRNFKQPISYSFCCGSTHKQDLAIQIKEIISKLHTVGVKVVATVCDQGASNTSAINALVHETRVKYLKENKEHRNYVFEVDGEEVIPLYDVPHLMKGIRNNLLTKDLTCTINGHEKTAKWDHIVQLYKNDYVYQGLKLLPKLTEQHVDPKKMLKMKVKCATQVFSRSVALNMAFFTDKKILPEECKDTADVILFFDGLFDSFNGSYQNKHRFSKPLLGALTPNSVHQDTWTAAKLVLSTMKFKSKNVLGKSESVPSVKNWLLTIQNMELLKQKIFARYKIKSLWLRHFNQDPLENFFGGIRSHGIRNINPTCSAFQSAFAALLINNLSGLHSPGANCEKDNCKNFQSLGKMFFTKNTTAKLSESTIDYNDVSSSHIIGINNKENNPKIMAQLEYVTGYVLKKSRVIFKKCSTCNKSLCNQNKSSDYLRRKEHSKNKFYLSYPSDNLISLFSNMQDIISYVVQKDSAMINIKAYIQTLIALECDFNFISCNEHRNELIEMFQDLSIRLILYSWCKDTNNIIKGTRQHFNQSDDVQVLARNIYLKRKK